MNYSYEYNYPVTPEAAAGIAGVGMAIFGGLILFWLILALAIYVYFAVCLIKIAHKTNTPNAWFAWIPILNLVLTVQISQKPLWWVILFFIPLANIVATVFIWMNIAKIRNKPDWLGILMIITVANLIIPSYLAFSD